jgi:hypothetical protein
MLDNKIIDIYFSVSGRVLGTLKIKGLLKHKYLMDGGNRRTRIKPQSVD